MGNFKQSEHLTIINLDDAIEFLSENEIEVLKNLFLKMHLGRVARGKSRESYLIVNTKEPYYRDVIKLIEDGEIVKNTLNQVFAKTLQWKDQSFPKKEA